MKLTPLSWFSDIAEKIGVPTWVVWVGAFVLGYFVLHFLGILP